MFFIRQTLLFSAVLLCFLPTSGYGKTLNAVFTEWYPYTYLKDGQAAGFSIEIYREALKGTDLQFKFQQLPWARALKEFDDGNFDAILDSNELATENCSKNPPVPWIISFWVHKNSELEEFINYSQMNNKAIAYVRGYTYPDTFNNYKAFGKIVSVTDDKAGLRILDAGRVDAFIGDILNNTELVKQHLFNVKPLMPAIELQFLTLCFSSQLSHELKRFEKSLAAMYKDGRLDRIYKKYFDLTYQELVSQYSFREN